MTGRGTGHLVSQPDVLCGGGEENRPHTKRLAARLLDTLLEASTRNEQQNRYSRLSLSIGSLQDPLKPRIRSFPHLLHVSEQNHVRYQHGR